jgi:hypothetical protein
MAVEKKLYEFVIALNGKRTVKQILQLINIEIDEIQDFIDFLLQSSLIIPAL